MTKKIINDAIFESIKKSLVDDMQIAYEVFKAEGHDDIEGVIFHINSTEGFGVYLKNNPSKLADLTDYLFSNLDFAINLIFSNEGEPEFYPLLPKN